MALPHIRVIVADDHPLLLTGLITSLSEHSHIEVVGSARQFSDLRHLLAHTQADVLVLDIWGMGKGPFVAVEGVLHTHPTLGIVVYSSSIDLAPELFRLGIRGYVTKETAPAELLAAIEHAHGGRRYCSRAVQEYMDRSARANKNFRLPPQEVSVLKLNAQGKLTHEIAEELCINGRTALNYFTNLYRRTGCRTRQELTQWYYQIYLPSMGLKE